MAVVLGSTRPTRICADIAAWACEAIGKGSELRYELLDLAEVDLPFPDEPRRAALGDYQHEHTRAWNRTAQSYDGLLFVFPQYSWGYPAALKNALGHLYREWRDKPASFITYGTRGGTKAAEQFTEVLHGPRMRVLDHVEAVITGDDIDEHRQLKDPNTIFHPVLPTLTAVDSQMTEALDDIPATFGYKNTLLFESVEFQVAGAQGRSLRAGSAVVPMELSAQPCARPETAAQFPVDARHTHRAVRGGGVFPAGESVPLALVDGVEADSDARAQTRSSRRLVARSVRGPSRSGWPCRPSRWRRRTRKRWSRQGRGWLARP
ncbi:NADPH-dependent FMN reductase [Streptomyces sp. NPDC088847]|uniref:NADPH-dependent FMN reductase n=1 Tax=Streptomyces sp. NPDC088847 TaxID=3365909 RepID=UPI0037FC8958